MQKTKTPTLNLRANKIKNPSSPTLTFFLFITLIAQPGLSDTPFEPLGAVPHGLEAALRMNIGTLSTDRSIFFQQVTDHQDGSRVNLTPSTNPLSVSIFQKGLNQEITLQGRGESNQIALEQAGVGNQITGYVSGQHNAATVTQSGRLNSAHFMQYGVMNSVFIQQGAW